MTQARSTLVSLQDTPWYHCVSRCVRRAWLFGDDPISGRNFDHRRGWIVDRIKTLANLFAIDIAAYAIMSNHYHVIVRIDRERAGTWSVDEVLERWSALFSAAPLVSRYQTEGADLSDAELVKVGELAETCRQRLTDLSWFMRTLNEPIARQANAEDAVKGRFWEGRFKSQALLDEQALLAAMAYVDLNPVRAGNAATPEASDFTSIQERIQQLGDGATLDVPVDEAPDVTRSESPAAPSATVESVPAQLMPFDATGRLDWAVPFAFKDYLELVDWTGRALRPDKRGHIDGRHPKILNRLGIDGETFIRHATHLLKDFGVAVGAPPAMIKASARRNCRYLRGIGAAQALFAWPAAAKMV